MISFIVIIIVVHFLAQISQMGFQRGPLLKPPENEENKI